MSSMPFFHNTQILDIYIDCFGLLVLVCIELGIALKGDPSVLGSNLLRVE
jgi:hypothetical protein